MYIYKVERLAESLTAQKYSQNIDFLRYGPIPMTHACFCIAISKDCHEYGAPALNNIPNEKFW